MATYGDNWFHTQMVEIAREQLTALDQSRIHGNEVIGQDNWDKLYVSTVFSAIAIEAALNDFLQTHCLFARSPYLQEFFSEAVEKLLWGPFEQKLKRVRKFSTAIFDTDLLGEVKTLIKIRNRIIHQKGKFIAGHNSDDGQAKIHAVLSRVEPGDMAHMLRHVDIAEQFLNSFGPPGSAELEKWADSSAGIAKQITFRFVGGPVDGQMQECLSSDRQSWWTRTAGGTIGARLEFIPDDQIAAVKDGVGFESSATVRYEIVERTERADEVVVVTEFRGVVDEWPPDPFGIDEDL